VLRDAVESASNGLGDFWRQGALVIIDAADEAEGSANATDLLREARLLIHAVPALQVLITSRPSAPLTGVKEQVLMPLLDPEKARVLIGASKMEL
jgi:hypothetical protein